VTIEREQVIGLAGFLLVATGAFLPVADLGMWTLTDFYKSSSDSIFVLGLDVVAVAILFARQYRWLLFVALAQVAILVVTAFRLRSAMLATGCCGFVWWGWVALVVGAGTLGVAGLLPRRR